MMIAGQKIEIDSKSWSIKQSFSSLIDAMRFSQRYEQLKEEQISLELEREKKILALEKLIQDISSKIQDSEESLGKDYAFELSKQIPPFSKAAADNVRKKIEDYYNKALKEMKSWIESEKTRSYKSIESFLSTSPIPVLEAVISQKLLDGAYSARCNYRCENDIRYEFTLDTKRNTVFGQEFKISSLGYEVKLPVTLGKSWLRKGPTPEYERLDQYILTDSEATEGHLIANFAHPEREAKVRVVYSKHEGSSSPLLEINYKDHERNVDILREPGLNRFFKTEAAVRAMDRIWLAATELEKNKIALTALSCNGEDVLQQLNTKGFIETAWKSLSPILMKTLKNSPPTSATISTGDMLDEAYVREKAALLGESGQTVLMMLGL
jgi:hypothetical protein